MTLRYGKPGAEIEHLEMRNANMTPKDIGWNLENSYANLPEFFYSKLELNPVRAPKVVMRPLNLRVGIIDGKQDYKGKINPKMNPLN